jgi:hypothetical protein
LLATRGERNRAPVTRHRLKGRHMLAVLLRSPLSLPVPCRPCKPFHHVSFRTPTAFRIRGISWLVRVCFALVHGVAVSCTTLSYYRNPPPLLSHAASLSYGHQRCLRCAGSDLTQRDKLTHASRATTPKLWHCIAGCCTKLLKNERSAARVTCHTAFTCALLILLLHPHSNIGQGICQVF